MKKKLLLTTALVAFSMPALADVSDLGVVVDWNASAEDIASLSKVEGKSAQTKIYSDNRTLIFVTNAVNATVADGAIFKLNKADSGGSFAISGGGKGVLNVNTATFSQNEAYYDGGAIANYGTLNVVGTTFSENIAQAVATEGADEQPVGGGAIALGSVSNTSIKGATFSNNTSYRHGGAIGTRLGKDGDNSAAKLDIEATFTGNHAAEKGGAIYNTFYAGEKGVTVKGTFTSNTAGIDGGAIFNDGEKDNKGNGNPGGVMTILSGSKFTGNKAEGTGGAIRNRKGDLTIEDGVTFTGNEADVSGAVSSDMDGSTITVGAATFDGNHASADAGALGIYGDGTLTGTVFKNNTAGIKIGGVDVSPTSDGGGAFMLGGTANATLNNVTFEGNKAGGRGGAISARHTSTDYVLNITNNSKFTNNSAGTYGGAIVNIYKGLINISDTTFEANSAGKNGGAIYNGKDINYGSSEGGSVSTNHGTINLSGVNTFSNNSAEELGGAIYNGGGTLTLSGTNTFSGNTAGGKANDIHNLGELNVSGELTLDGGITGDGTLAFKDNATLGATYNTTKIENKTDLSGLQKIKLAISEVVDSLELDNLFTHEDNAEDGYGYNPAGLTIENSMYDFTLDETDTTYSRYTVAQKSSEEIAENLGTTTEDASALLSATSSSSDNQAFNEATGALNLAAQSGDASAVSEAKKLGATETPVVSSQETGVHDVLFGVVTSELNGEHGAMARGLASGDYFRKASAWIRGLFNKADHETTNKAEGFNSDTYGVAMGIDSEVNENTRLGFGYANSQTDIKSAGRDTDVDTNSLFVYAKYQPKDWYINTILAYSWSEYDEKKSVMGYDASAKYDVDTIALQSMYGYETAYKGYDVTPEFGLRYLHIDQDAYKNKLGSEVSANQEDVLTAVFGAKLAKNYALENGAVVRPELRAAVTYDLFDADNSANVLLANGASYTVDGEKLDRLGFELGAKVTTKATEKVEVSAGYLTRIREDYQDHTLTVDAKYNF